MEYKTTAELSRIAELYKDHPKPKPLTRREKMDRWAQLLGAEPDRRLSTLHETEYQPLEARNALRADDSPISVAFADPVLRGEGMKGDTYGDAKLFFELTDHELHDILCYCHFGTSMSADSAAARVSAVARGGAFARVWQRIAG